MSEMAVGSLATSACIRVPHHCQLFYDIIVQLRGIKSEDLLMRHRVMNSNVEGGDRSSEHVVRSIP